MRKLLAALLTLSPLCFLVVLLVETAATAQVPIGTTYGFAVTVAKGVASGQFVVVVTVTDLANGKVVAKPQLLGPANTDLTLVGTNGDYEYQVVTRPTATTVVSSVEIRHAGSTTLRQQLTVAVPQ